jgi:hypothetical protein
VAISEKSRSALYQDLVSIAGEEAVGEMLSYFPARDVDEPVSKELLRAEIADVKTEIGSVRTEIGGVRNEIAAVKVTIADVRTEIADLRTEMHRSLNRHFVAMSGVIGLATTVIIAVLR